MSAQGETLGVVVKERLSPERAFQEKTARLGRPFRTHILFYTGSRGVSHGLTSFAPLGLSKLYCIKSDTGSA